MTASTPASALGPLVIESVDIAAMADLAVILGDPNPLQESRPAVGAGLGSERAR